MPYFHYAEKTNSPEIRAHFVDGRSQQLGAKIAMETKDQAEKKFTLYYVGPHSTERAMFANICMSIGHNCEFYDDLRELAEFPPRDGIIVLQDSPELGGLRPAIERLESLGIWLAVLATGDSSTPSVIVDAVKSGALDYLVCPVQAGRLERCLARVADEAPRATQLRRRRVEAKAMLSTLSRREAHVLEFLCQGLSNKQIARELTISPRTVEIHRAGMMRKLGATHAAGAVRIKIEASRAA